MWNPVTENNFRRRNGFRRLSLSSQATPAWRKCNARVYFNSVSTFLAYQVPVLNLVSQESTVLCMRLFFCVDTY